MSEILQPNNHPTIQNLIKEGYTLLKDQSNCNDDDKASWLIALFALRAIEYLNSQGALATIDFEKKPCLAVTDDSEIALDAILKTMKMVESAIPLLEGVFSKKLIGRQKIDDAILRHLTELFAKFTFHRREFDEWQTVSIEFQLFLNQILDRLSMKAGELASPASVAKLIANIIKPQGGASVYDPACGTGGFLAAAARQVRQNQQEEKPLDVYGQDISPLATAIAPLNIFFSNQTGTIVQQDSLQKTESANSKDSFDYVIANPPFGGKVETDKLHGDYLYFSKWYSQLMSSEIAFIQRMINAAAPKGKIAIVIPKGVLFRGGKDKMLRKRMLEDDIVQAVIELPANMFYGTTIPVCILLLDKDKVKGKPVFFIDGSREYIETKPRREFSPEGIAQIVSTFHNHKEIKGFSKLVSLQEIESNDGDLSVTRYVIPQNDHPKLDYDEELGKLKSLLEQQEILFKELDGRS